VTLPSLPAATLPLFFAVLGNLIYHLASRGTSGSPFAVLAVVYLFACIGCAAIALGIEGGNARTALSTALSPASLIFAVAVVMIEVSFIYVYRSGVPLASASLLVNASVAILLAAIGVMLFREGMNWRLAAGIVLTLAGVILTATSGVKPA
jgi:drug/metabolite transporter (DMT)-like permease